MINSTSPLSCFHQSFQVASSHCPTTPHHLILPHFPVCSQHHGKQVAQGTVVTDMEFGIRFMRMEIRSWVLQLQFRKACKHWTHKTSPIYSLWSTYTDSFFLAKLEILLFLSLILDNPWLSMFTLYSLRGMWKPWGIAWTTFPEKSWTHSFGKHCSQAEVLTQTGPWSSSKNLLKMQILRPHPRLTESETLQMEPSNLCFNKPWGDSDVPQSLGNQRWKVTDIIKIIYLTEELEEIRERSEYSTEGKTLEK